MISLHVIYRQQQKENFCYTGQQLRIWNEVPTVILFAVVFLVIFKSGIGAGWGLLGLAALLLVLMIAIRVYKAVRKQ
jgi:putative membrane protein